VNARDGREVGPPLQPLPSADDDATLGQNDALADILNARPIERSRSPFTYCGLPAVLSGLCTAVGIFDDSPFSETEPASGHMTGQSRRPARETAGINRAGKIPMSNASICIC